ncbi:MAG: alpha/beta hydrolase [Gemmatimonadota bacterium]|nr:MAG: alpha/beta hydrolase [Gemmatimonadota bacterium]
MKDFKTLLLLVFVVWHGFLSCSREDTKEEEPLPGVIGNVVHHGTFPTNFVEPRTVDVWLPPGYAESHEQRYPVLYMHDGQNLFDPVTSFIGVDWGIDETMTRLIEERRIREAIVVGIGNAPQRIQEYMPQKPVETMLSSEKKAECISEQGEPLSDRYLRFIVSELKPFIDATYRTLPERAQTFIMGSSMGGLISVYAVCEYPDIFGGAGCVSTHWPAGDGVVIEYLKKTLPDPNTHKIYFDYGTETVDAAYEPYQMKVDTVMQKAGYTRGENWITKKFPGHEHSERAWRQRVHIPLTFFFGSSDSSFFEN